VVQDQTDTSVIGSRRTRQRTVITREKPQGCMYRGRMVPFSGQVIQFVFLLFFLSQFLILRTTFDYDFCLNFYLFQLYLHEEVCIISNVVKTVLVRSVSQIQIPPCQRCKCVEQKGHNPVFVCKDMCKRKKVSKRGGNKRYRDTGGRTNVRIFDRVSLNFLKFNFKLHKIS
jgi:hypothetical protein